MLGRFLMVCIFANFVLKCASGDPTVQTDMAEIIGTSSMVAVGGEEYTVDSYLGIPFGQPPVGERRFQKPVPVDKLSSPFVAQEHGAECEQPKMPFLPLLETVSEDCLFLNVYVPHVEPDRQSGFAVMVYIHGGAFQAGQSRLYSGRILSAYGKVIVVTVNYRLAFLGFLTTGDDHAPGNLGLWDQHLALQWVHKNIGAFGGDKNRVTVFGDSAGSASVIYQALYPGNKGLVHRVIAESGAPTMRPLLNTDPVASTRLLADLMGCNKENSKVMLACFRRFDPGHIFSEIDLALQKDPELFGTYGPFQFMPIVDGEFLRTDPGNFRRSSVYSEELEFYRSVDAIIGVSREEGYFGLSWIQGIRDLESFKPSREFINKKVIPRVLKDTVAGNVGGFATKLITAEYTKWENPDDPERLRNEAIRLYGDTLFFVPAVEFAQLHCNSSDKDNTFFYQFSAKPSTRLLPTGSWFHGTQHIDDLPFVFGFDEEMTNEVKRIPELEWKMPEPWEFETSLKIMRFWSTFAKTGDPNSVDNSEREWPVYDLQHQKALKIDGDVTNAVHIDFIYAKEANFWLDLIPEAQKIEAAMSARSETGSCFADGECDNQ